MKIFFLTSKFPFPLDEGDKLRAYWQMKHLSRFHEIHLCALSRRRVPKLNLERVSFCPDVRIVPCNAADIAAGLLRASVSDLPFQAGYFCSPRIRNRVRSLLKEIKPDLIFCQLIRMAPLVAGAEAPVALDYMDSLARRVLQKGNYPGIPSGLLDLEFKKTRAYEKRLLEACAVSFTTTERDRADIAAGTSASIFVSGNGVDTEAWKPIAGTAEYDFIFAGNMGYGPNVSAARILARDIMPRIHARIPRARLLLAGTNPARSIRKLRSDRIHVSGHVPSMPEAYARARIFVAPMWSGTGIQNKVIQALAMGKPCVISPIVAAGFNPAIRRIAVLADSPAEFARACLNLLSEPARLADCSAKSLEFVRAHHRWEDICSDLNRMLEKYGSRPGPDRA